MEYWFQGEVRTSFTGAGSTPLVLDPVEQLLLEQVLLLVLDPVEQLLLEKALLLLVVLDLVEQLPLEKVLLLLLLIFFD